MAGRGLGRDGRADEIGNGLGRDGSADEIGNGLGLELERLGGETPSRQSLRERVSAASASSPLRQLAIREIALSAFEAGGLG